MIYTEIEYDDRGIPKILRTFSKPLKSSSIQYGQKKQVTKPEPEKFTPEQKSDVDLF
jgi:hypothetical protein